MSTHYETLNVNESATPDEIKRAYRKLASQHHPDKGGDTAKFQQVEEAYRILSDPQQREQYDLERKGGGPNNIHFQWHGGMPGDIHDIFRNFGFGDGSPFGHRGRRNKDLRVTIEVPIESTLDSQTKTISVATTNGQRETVQVSIPRGITNGTNIKYSGLGDNLFTSLPRGDLYVQINLTIANNYGIHGVDIHTDIPVNSLVAIIGGEAEVKNIDGKIFIIKIPEGTQTGTKFRIAGQGLYHMNSSIRGDLYAEIVLTTPTLSGDDKQKIQDIINNTQ